MDKGGQTVANTSEQIWQDVVKAYVYGTFVKKIDVTRRTINNVYQSSDKQNRQANQNLAYVDHAPNTFRFIFI